MADEDAEDVEDVVAVIGERIWMDYGVKMNGYKPDDVKQSG